jgi:hypothetical protein
VPDPSTPIRPDGVGHGPTLGRARGGWWGRLGGEGLVASLLIHGGLLLLFAAWVIATITDEAKVDPETFATGSGGGAMGERARVLEHKLQPRIAQNPAQTTSRITSKSTTTSVTLPELPTTSASALMSGLAGGSPSKGLGGGVGGGIGSGVGIGVGHSRNFVSVFGSKGSTGGLLGEFWDIKLDRKGQPIAHPGVPRDYGYSAEAMVEYLGAIASVIRMKGDANRALARYFKAETTLVSSTFVHPYMSAAEAPRAFGVEREVRPVHWLAVYRGKAAAPFADQFRFVGGCDNVIVVLVDGKVVFDGSRRYTHHAPPSRYYTTWKQTTEPIPGSLTGNIRTFNGSNVWGDWFSLRKGEVVDLTIILGESGGIYACGLFLDWKGAGWHRKGGSIPPGGIPPVFQVGPCPPDVQELIRSRSAPHGYVPFFDPEPVFRPVGFGTVSR